MPLGQRQRGAAWWVGACVCRVCAAGRCLVVMRLLLLLPWQRLWCWSLLLLGGEMQRHQRGWPCSSRGGGVGVKVCVYLLLLYFEAIHSLPSTHKTASRFQQLSAALRQASRAVQKMTQKLPRFSVVPLLPAAEAPGACRFAAIGPVGPAPGVYTPFAVVCSGCWGPIPSHQRCRRDTDPELTQPATTQLSVNHGGLPAPVGSCNTLV